eukprot:1569131-Amphidinium_carterae.1
MQEGRQDLRDDLAAVESEATSSKRLLLPNHHPQTVRSEFMGTPTQFLLQDLHISADRFSYMRQGASLSEVPSLAGTGGADEPDAASPTYRSTTELPQHPTLDGGKLETKAREEAGARHPPDMAAEVPATKLFGQVQLEILCGPRHNSYHLLLAS